MYDKEFWEMVYELHIKTIPMWKWILLHFTRTYKSFDCEGQVCCVIHAKMLFKNMYIWQEDHYNTLTGELIRSRKLTRRG